MENTVLFVLGLLLLGAGLIEIGIIIPQHLEDEVNSQIVANEKVIEGNKFYNERFLNNTQDDSLAAYQDYYLYNLTNPQAVLAGKVPIQMEEVGPIVFRKYFEKDDVSFYDDKVKAKWWVYFKYEQEKSNPNLPLSEIKICAPDPSYAGLVSKTRSNITIQFALSNYFNQMAIRCRSAEEWLAGYVTTLPPPLSVSIVFPGYLENQTKEQAEDLGYSIWNTGIWDQYQLMNLLQYNGMQADTCWKTPQSIHASDNSQFPLGLTSDQAVYSYLPPLHRTMKWIYDSQSSVYGLSTLKYKMDPAIFLNAQHNPDNADFFQNGPDGFLNISLCVQPLYVYATQPHFYGCDPSFGEVFDPPLVANESDVSYIQIEPITGIPVTTYILLQQNRYFEVPTNLIKVKNLTNPIPIFWSKISNVISVEKANDFTDSLYTTKDIAQVIWWVGVVSGSFVCFVALLIFIRVQVRHRRRKLLLKRSMRQSSRQRLLIDREAARVRRLTTT